MSGPYQLAIFDLDGTLADTKLDLADATNHALSELGCPTHSSEKIASMVGGGIRVLVQRALGPKGGDPSLVDRAYALFMPRYRAHMLDSTRPYPGMSSLLERLSGAGVRLAIATNKPRMFTLGIVEALFPSRFDPIITCGEEVPRKPDPGCVRRIMECHREMTPRQAVFLGDSPVDVETAVGAGIEVIAVSWGFGKRGDLVLARPTYLVDRVEEAGEVLLGSAP